MPSTLSVLTSRRYKNRIDCTQSVVAVVYRSNNNANANGGVSYANANNGFTNANTRIGVRLANHKAQIYKTFFSVLIKSYTYVPTLSHEMTESAYRELSHGKSKQLFVWKIEKLMCGGEFSRVFKRILSNPFVHQEMEGLL